MKVFKLRKWKIKSDITVLSIISKLTYVIPITLKLVPVLVLLLLLLSQVHARSLRKHPPPDDNGATTVPEKFNLTFFISLPTTIYPFFAVTTRLVKMALIRVGVSITFALSWLACHCLNTVFLIFVFRQPNQTLIGSGEVDRMNPYVDGYCDMEAGMSWKRWWKGEKGGGGDGDDDYLFHLFFKPGVRTWSNSRKHVTC